MFYYYYYYNGAFFFWWGGLVAFGVQGAEYANIN